MIPRHVLTYMRIEDPPQRPEVRAALWTALGIPPDRLDYVMRADLRWCGTRQLLLVNKSMAADLECIPVVEELVAYLLQFRQWSDTRWGGHW